jgi:hypothetical protein
VYSAIDGEAVAVPDPVQVISPELSDTLRRLMIHVVDAGPHYAEETLIPNYVVGGKTGTAQIWDVQNNQWMPHIYNHTFVGFVGAERPEAIIVVRIHEAKPEGRGRDQYRIELTSNELFRRVALDTIDVLDIAPLPEDAPQQTPEPAVGVPADEPEVNATAPPMMAGG